MMRCTIGPTEHQLIPDTASTRRCRPCDADRFGGSAISAGLLVILPQRTASRNIRCTVIATFSTLLGDNPVAGPSGLADLRPDTAS